VGRRTPPWWAWQFLLVCRVAGCAWPWRSPLTQTWIWNKTFWNKSQEAKSRDKALSLRWGFLEEEPARDNVMPRKEEETFLISRQWDNRSPSLFLEKLNALNCTNDYFMGQDGIYTTCQGHECVRSITKQNPQFLCDFLITWSYTFT